MLEVLLTQMAVYGSALIVVSIGSIVLLILVVPWIVGTLPADYFAQPNRRVAQGTRTTWGWALLILKNVAGGLLVLVGIPMLIGPGQGVLTVLVGLMLMNFPGKFQLERWLVRRPAVLKGLNWIRRRQGRPPFVL